MQKRYVLWFLIALAIAIPAILAFAIDGEAHETTSSQSEGAKPSDPVPVGMERAVLAGGCFWGVEAVFEELAGVVDVQSGYAGGDAETAYYYVVGTGRTGHAESVEVIYDPESIDYRTLLDVFFTVAHDPTQLNYQGPDHGTEYRSVIFYEDERQQRIAEEFIDALSDAGVYSKPIVTELSQLSEFYPAEPYHQDFMDRNPTHPYILAWDLPKVQHLQREFPELVAAQSTAD